ncbi:hypothetical protein MY04_3360 [Flammeovirga sp. MY04]|uniref:hypothetical protein n=1 Tax=Flammeovirga sp. MY04 TaxID=1191459 RepID=UPI0008062ECB|nr:hypothetical protein [Flammeovirga sp. MY04]ANQ50722.1 hypothetical protein MY04_3360 [Flammeovirga sp. MY04]
MNKFLIVILLKCMIVFSSYSQITLQEGQHIFINHGISTMSCFDCNLTFDWIVDMDLNQEEYIESSGNNYMITPETDIKFEFKIMDDNQPDDNTSCSSYGQDYQKEGSCNFCYKFIYNNYSYYCPLNDYNGIYIPEVTSHSHKVKPNCLLLTYSRFLIEEDTPKVGFFENGNKGYFPPDIFKKTDQKFYWLVTKIDGGKEIIKNKEVLSIDDLVDTFSIQVISNDFQSRSLLLSNIL